MDAMFSTSQRVAQRAQRLQAAGRIALAAATVAVLAACSALPQKPQPVARYDFGPTQALTAPSTPSPHAEPLVLANVRAAGVPDASAAIYYRLAYADVRELRPYTQASWVLPAMQLIQQRMRDVLSGQRAVVLDDDGANQLLRKSGYPAMLRLEVVDFSQVFDSAQSSQGVLRMRATLSEITPKGERWLAQQVFNAQQPAASADAAGAAAALATATDQVAQQLDTWLRQQGR